MLMLVLKLLAVNLHTAGIIRRNKLSLKQTFLTFLKQLLPLHQEVVLNSGPL